MRWDEIYTTLIGGDKWDETVETKPLSPILSQSYDMNNASSYNGGSIFPFLIGRMVNKTHNH
jgi:hypothetical protein